MLILRCKVLNLLKSLGLLVLELGALTVNLPDGSLNRALVFLGLLGWGHFRLRVSHDDVKFTCIK